MDTFLKEVCASYGVRSTAELPEHIRDGLDDAALESQRYTEGAYWKQNPNKPGFSPGQALLKAAGLPFGDKKNHNPDNPAPPGNWQVLCTIVLKSKR